MHSDQSKELSEFKRRLSINMRHDRRRSSTQLPQSLLPPDDVTQFNKCVAGLLDGTSSNTDEITGIIENNNKIVLEKDENTNALYKAIIKVCKSLAKALLTVTNLEIKNRLIKTTLKSAIAECINSAQTEVLTYVLDSLDKKSAKEFLKDFIETYHVSSIKANDILKQILSYFDKQEIKDILQQKNQYGSNALHCFAQRDSDEERDINEGLAMLQTVIEYFKDDPSTLFAMLNETKNNSDSNKGETPLDLNSPKKITDYLVQTKQRVEAELAKQLLTNIEPDNSAAEESQQAACNEIYLTKSRVNKKSMIFFGLEVASIAGAVAGIALMAQKPEYNKISLPLLISSAILVCVFGALLYMSLKQNNEKEPLQQLQETTASSAVTETYQQINTP